MNNFQNKKIGIWGFGVVGQSALTFFDACKAQNIEILDTKKITLPSTKTTTVAILQTQENIESFLEANDFIIPSPGIKLHNYQQFAHKFINELDLLHSSTNYPTIAITGTIGKTSITSILEVIFKATYPQTIAAGNIGNPMLSLTNKPNINHVILELSSFQLQPIQSFAPDLAIITNFFPNHLDHHQSIEEYFYAKTNILKYQTGNQQALIPLDLVQKITEKIHLSKNWVFFSPNKPAEKQFTNTIYYLENRIIYQTNQNQTQAIFDCTTLPPLTFGTNWLIIIATCHLRNISLQTIVPSIKNMQLPDHRLQKVGSYQGCNFYNDSKSTVWQATLQAVQAVSDKPIKLFVGGLSKGADRTPLFQALQDKNIEIYAFGKESDQIAQLCKQFKIKHHQDTTLDGAFRSCIQNLENPCEIIFSPGGSSFDLFENYQARGQYFTQLVQKYCSIEQ